MKFSKSSASSSANSTPPHDHSAIKTGKAKPNNNWAKLPLFNRKNWTHLRFGDIVENVNERVEPSMAAEAIYVGLDDLDSGSLHSRLQKYRLGAKGGDWLADAMKKEAK